MSRRLLFIRLWGLSGLFLSACTYALPPQPTVYITVEEPDRLSKIIEQHPLPIGTIAVLGGQILRRYDPPAGRYFLIRNLPLDHEGSPHPPRRRLKGDPDTEFILFTPALHMIGEHRTRIRREKSAFVVFGEGENRTVVMGPGHFLTTVGDIRGLSPFPADKASSRTFLLLVGEYVVLWGNAHSEDFQLVLK